MRALLTALTLSVFLLPSPGDAATLRCGNALAADGASKADVLLKCGEPMSKDTRTESVGEKTRQKGPEGDTTQERVVYKTIEEWTYNFGPRHFMQVVVFENGLLVDVRSAGYGR